jgi:hypothetical protein
MLWPYHNAQYSWRQYGTPLGGCKWTKQVETVMWDLRARQCRFYWKKHWKPNGALALPPRDLLYFLHKRVIELPGDWPHYFGQNRHHLIISTQSSSLCTVRRDQASNWASVLTTRPKRNIRCPGWFGDTMIPPLGQRRFVLEPLLSTFLVLRKYRVKANLKLNYTCIQV